MMEQSDKSRSLAERLAGLVGRMASEANRRVGLRQSIERRWIEDLLQYHGRYDARTERALNNAKAKSKLFINMTRPKTDAMSARLMDLLFPTDDKNWGIKPTPVPSLTEQAKQAVALAGEMAEKAKQAQEQAGGVPGAAIEAAALQQEADQAAEAAAQLDGMIAEGRKRAELMTAEIDDQLKESQYHSVMRDVIEDACKLGTGVCKGPVTGDRLRQGWKRQAVEVLPEVQEEYSLQMASGDRPAMRWVDIWSFYPDMEARTIKDSQGVYERHLMSAKKLRQTAKLPGFDADVIRDLLRDKPKGKTPSYLADLRGISPDHQQGTGDFYHVWEYSGPLDAEDMRDLAEASGEEGIASDLNEIDPLMEVNAVVWFCDEKVLKFALYPYDSGECMYSVFNLAKDEASIFGYGIPWIMRDPQKSLNASWRAMMDNAGLTSGPQIIVAPETIEPADGNWEITPRKIWKAKSSLPPQHRAFDAFNIPSQQGDLAGIVALSKQLIDDITAMPSIAQGEIGAGAASRTFGGQALQMNSATVVFRRIVKNFDDDVTTPNVRRFYDWNMQFNENEAIKGDFEIDARGSSVLLVRELQSQSLLWVAANLGGHPVFGPMLKNREVLRKIFQTMMIPATEVVLTDEEIDAVIAKSAAEDSAATVEAEMAQQKLSIEVEMANLEWNSRLQIEQMRRETEMMRYAAQANMKLDELDAMLTKNREQIAAKERAVLAEAEMTAAIGPSGGGVF